MSSFKTIEWKDNKVVMIDQRKLPEEEIYNVYGTYEEVGQAIKDMVVRGAPAIGDAAAMGIAIGAMHCDTENIEQFKKRVHEIAEYIKSTRPTAVNLFWASDRMLRVLENSPEDVEGLKKLLIHEAELILEEDVETCRRMGRLGSELLQDGMTVLTHCNAGALATGGYGTALGVIRAATEAGKDIRVIATETRPFLQGARLTAWELDRDGIPVSLITDNMVGYMMSKGKIDSVVTGADRIASNGDVANKIGTYTISVLAKSHGIPFYVAAPVSTIDYDCPDGSSIPIEERSADEVTHIKGHRIAPQVNVYNPAFDITPSDNVKSIITEEGIAVEPYKNTLMSMKK